MDLLRPEYVPKPFGDSLSLNVVHVEEVDVPADAEAVEWYLLTTEPIDTEEQVLRVVDYYRGRWQIEEFNKGLQTGCQYEKLQLETADRLWTMLAFYCPIVTNLLALRALARQEEDNPPAASVLDSDELDVLRAERPELGNKRLDVRTALALIARLGGHFASNGPPGWLVLLRGMATLQERVVGWRLAKHLAARAPPRSVPS